LKKDDVSIYEKTKPKEIITLDTAAENKEVTLYINNDKLKKWIKP